MCANIRIINWETSECRMNRNNSSQTLAGLRSFLFEWSLAAILLHLDFGWFSFIHTTFGQVEKKKTENRCTKFTDNRCLAYALLNEIDSFSRTRINHRIRWTWNVIEFKNKNNIAFVHVYLSLIVWIKAWARVLQFKHHEECERKTKSAC